VLFSFEAAAAAATAGAWFVEVVVVVVVVVVAGGVVVCVCVTVVDVVGPVTVSVRVVVVADSVVVTVVVVGGDVTVVDVDEVDAAAVLAFSVVAGVVVDADDCAVGVCVVDCGIAGVVVPEVVSVVPDAVSVVPDVVSVVPDVVSVVPDVVSVVPGAVVLVLVVGKVVVRLVVWVRLALRLLLRDPEPHPATRAAHTATRATAGPKRCNSSATPPPEPRMLPSVASRHYPTSPGSDEGPRSGRPVADACGTTRTGRREWWRTAEDTLPSSADSMRPSPRAPITIGSAPIASATEQMTRQGFPSSSRPSA
jgi:hypothetical protein